MLDLYLKLFFKNIFLFYFFYKNYKDAITLLSVYSYGK